jgi:hypothetical protein
LPLLSYQCLQWSEHALFIEFCFLKIQLNSRNSY